jgi:ADP-dependent NAD(P)H-hydrate dehydratase / NAD(P)H-hydrate epimerase
MTSIPSSHAVLTVAEMYAADKAADVPGLELMEAAGAAVARLVRERWTSQPVAVLCGPGNNGGDGFVVARLLAEAGCDVRVGLLGPAVELRGDAAVNAKKWRGEILALTPTILDGRTLAIDAIFGAGLSRGLNGAARAVVERINAEKIPCVAVDVPSGVAGDTGEVLSSGDGLGVAPQCAATVTFFRRKPAHLLFPGRALCGDTVVADIGIKNSVLETIALATAHNAPGLWTLPSPVWSDHKYNRGHVMVLGSALITGASRLGARGARRVGAGVVTMAVPASAVPIYAADAPGVFIRALDNTEDLDGLLADRLRNAVLVGPGADVGTETAVRVLKILRAGRAVVLDAGALTSFEDDPEQLFKAIRHQSAPVVMTPHEGEYRRLFKNAPGQGKLQQAREAAKVSGAVVILKGPDSVIAAPDGRAAIADNAPPWLATAGSGDVLAGFIVGLLAQGMPGWEAACAAVWLHGACAAHLGRGLIAEDLPEALPKVLKSL